MRGYSPEMTAAAAGLQTQRQASNRLDMRRTDLWVEYISDVSAVNHFQRDLFSVSDHLTRHRLGSDRQTKYFGPSMKQKSDNSFTVFVKQRCKTNSRSVPGPLCESVHHLKVHYVVFSEDVLIKSK